MLPRLHGAAVVARKEHHRSPECGRLEEPRRDDVHPHVPFVRSEHVSAHLREARLGPAPQVLPDGGLDRAVEVGDRRAALCAERGLAGGEEPRPAPAVDPVRLPPSDVVREPSAANPLEDALGDPHLFLAQPAIPERERAAAIADVDGPAGERRHGMLRELLGHVSGQRRENLRVGKTVAVHGGDLVLGHDAQKHVDAEVAHHLGDAVDPAVLVLEQLHLQSLEAADLLAKRGRQIRVNRDRERVVDDDHVVCGEVEVPARVDGARVVVVDAVPGVAPEGSQMLEERVGVAPDVVAENEDRERGAGLTELTGLSGSSTRRDGGRHRRATDRYR